jgi:FkbM family methyltransferase
LRFVWRAVAYRLHRNRHELAALRNHIAPGDIVIDIGSHKGGFLYWLVRFVGPGGHVYAFEPQPQLADYLQKIVARCGWTNVTLEAAAVSDRAGTLDLTIPAAAGQSSPGATLSPVGEAGPSHRVAVPVVALDAYVDARGASHSGPLAGRAGSGPAGPARVAAIKCDVEGHELEVFRGAERLLRESRPVLLFECEARHMTGGRTPNDVFDYLQARGYRGQFFSPRGLRPIEEFRLDLHQRPGAGRFWRAKGYCNNFLFVPDEPGR